MTYEEVAEIVRSSGEVFLAGMDSNASFSVRTAVPTLRLDKLSGILEFSPDDQVVRVKGGTPLWLIQEELGKHGQCLPLVEWYDGYAPTNVQNGTVGGSLSMNLPGYLDAECGTWRDWILGLTVVLADGTICKSGSHAVKSVAGYDVHKLFVGARGTLGVVVEAILRTYPVKSLPQPNMRANWKGRDRDAGEICIQRVPAEFFEKAWQSVSEFYGCAFPNTNTIWAWLPREKEPKRYPGDWLIRSGCGASNLEFTDPTQIKLMKRAKEIFDPTHKLNPGEMGIF